MTPVKFIKDNASSFHRKNREKIHEVMDDNSVFILFSGKVIRRSEDQYYDFSPDRNFYYLTGITQDNVILLITRYEDEIYEYIFAEESDPVKEKWVGKKLSFSEITDISAVEEVLSINNFSDKIHTLFTKEEFQHLCLDFKRIEYNENYNYVEEFATEMRKKYPFISIQNFNNDLTEFRMIKSNYEIKNMRKAVEITGEGILEILKNCNPEMYEYELEAYFNFSLNKTGIRERSFNTIVASGKNGTTLHYEENNSIIEDNSLVLVDLGAQYKLYCGDISRTFPINGKFTDRQKLLYNIVLNAMNRTIEEVKPGITLFELNEITKFFLAEGCKKIGLIKNDSELFKYYYHGVSHFLGLDAHDVSNGEVELEPGMVITVEPGLYIEEESIGIRIEDDILVTETGHENLASGIIKTVEDIEKFMKENNIGVK